MLENLADLSKRIPIVSALHHRFSLFLKAKPVLHLSAAILVVGFLPLFPPFIFSLISGLHMDDHRPPETKMGQHQRACSVESGTTDNLCEQRVNMDERCSLQGQELGGADQVPYISNTANTNCAETLLALGQKLNLSRATRTDLELIPGISSKLSGALVTNRERILKEAITKDEDQRHEAFQLVKGIGERISLKLSEFVGFD